MIGRRRRRRFAALVPLLLLAVISVGRLDATQAWTAQTANPVTGVTAGSLPNASASTSTPSLPVCTSIVLSWTAAGGAVTGYRIERRLDGGAWTTLVANNLTTTYTDLTGYTNQTVEYQIISKSATAWEGAVPALTPLLRCGVSDLAAANTCSSSVLTWSAAAAATTYDIRRSVNGGGYVAVATNLAATTWTDATQHANGVPVLYQVRPGIGAGSNGAWSNVATIASWQDFRVTSVQANNGGVAGTVGGGDTLVVTFSKPANPATLTTGGTMRLRTGTNVLYMAGTTNANSQIGRITLSGAQFGGNVNPATGLPAWSAGDTVFTWTWSAGATTHTAPLNTAGNAFVAGTVIKCTDGTALKSATAPTLGGQW